MAGRTRCADTRRRSRLPDGPLPLLPPEAPPSASPPPPAADLQLLPRFRDARPFRRPRGPENAASAPLPLAGGWPEERGLPAGRPRAPAAFAVEPLPTRGSGWRRAETPLHPSASHSAELNARNNPGGRWASARPPPAGIRGPAASRRPAPVRVREKCGWSGGRTPHITPGERHKELLKKVLVIVPGRSSEKTKKMGSEAQENNLAPVRRKVSSPIKTGGKENRMTQKASSLPTQTGTPLYGPHLKCSKEDHLY
ncbi:translation initiation factor IF-2-like isoform X2 [Papio anubis]|uniref:translation initiation factor IF-2-like isoform X2 n=1 Tax=Papio anubis TaxID=9555 RepID=UPI0012AD4CFD|nr:translation initiation factor IF-2-like isoform X2 [Papio anubis]